MIVSADLGNNVGDTDALVKAIVKQLEIITVSAVVFFFASRYQWLKIKYSFYQYLCIVVAGLLFVPLLFNSRNGAHAWIGNGSLTFQPSELAKVFSIMLCAKMFNSNPRYDLLKTFKSFAIYEGVLILIILEVQNDMGTALILLGMVFCMLYIVYYKNRLFNKIHNWMSVMLLFLIGFVVVLMLPQVNEFLSEHTSSYKIARITSSANPFSDQYASGYHLVMSLTAMANGGLFGVGYGQSIHKFMNFPNPSSDFIVAVIIEEIGFVGFLVIALFYMAIMLILIFNAFKTKHLHHKIIYLGSFVYFFMHFVLNVGGVSSLIPLTGVPLLIVSSGGSSTLCAFMALGLCYAELKAKENESDSRQIQEK